MKMDALAHAPINQLALISLRLEPCNVKAEHRYIMHPASVERFIYITQGSVCFFLTDGEMRANEWDMVYLPRDTAYHSKWLTDANYVVVDLLLRDTDGQDIRFAEAPAFCFMMNTMYTTVCLLNWQKKWRQTDPSTGWNECPCPLSYCVKWHGIPTARKWTKSTAELSKQLPIWKVTTQAIFLFIHWQRCALFPPPASVGFFWNAKEYLLWIIETVCVSAGLQNC